MESKKANYFDIGFSEKHSLPDIKEWFNPSENNKEYYYNIDELQQIKQKLNVKKHLLDKYQINANKFYKISSLTRNHDLLRGNYGMLVTNYNAEVVTNAWLKMYEILKFIEQYIKKIAKSRTPDLTTFHLAEAPGNFLLATNHFITTHYGNVNWKWYANSYRDLYSEKSIYLQDTYHLMKIFPENWLYGADCDGDITSPANIRSFLNTKVNIVTSDVKYVPEKENYDEEENINIPVHLGHTISSLKLLKKGGVAILKHLTLCESASVSILYLLSCCFKYLYLFKPETSKSANSEIYVLGLCYYGTSEEQIDKLLEIMEFIRPLNDDKPKPCLFKRSCIPESFIKKIILASEKLADEQMINIQEMVDNYELNKYKNIRKLEDELYDTRVAICSEWIKKMDIQELKLKLIK